MGKNSHRSKILKRLFLFYTEDICNPNSNRIEPRPKSNDDGTGPIIVIEEQESESANDVREVQDVKYRASAPTEIDIDVLNERLTMILSLCYLSLSCMNTMLFRMIPMPWAVMMLDPYSALSHTQSFSALRLQKASEPSVW